MTASDDIFLRTEDIPPEDILKYFVETEKDRQIVSTLKSKAPSILVGSRGVGKSFLLRVAQAQMRLEFEATKVLPVYVSFMSSPLLQGLSEDAFNKWMLTKILLAVIRESKKVGANSFPRLKILDTAKATDSIAHNADPASTLENIADMLESAWRLSNPASRESTAILIPDAEQVKFAIEDFCESQGIFRIALLIDEASHIFIPHQQRLFFSLFRDLRSPRISCKAAVYPGVTSYGPTFQPNHDATMLSTERNVLDDGYLKSMKDIALKQVPSALGIQIENNDRNFSILAYAAHGNPRILLKSLTQGVRLSSDGVNRYIREYYRSDFWAEHSQLAQRYPGHRDIIDWGRNFIESDLIPRILRKNSASSNPSTAYFWLHRDTPAPVMYAMGILKYTGVISDHAEGVKTGHGEVGSKYILNIGCLLSALDQPVTQGTEIIRNLDDKSFVQYSKDTPLFSEIVNFSDESIIGQSKSFSILQDQLTKSIDVLELSDFQRKTLKSVEILSINDILTASDARIQQARGIGAARTRRIKNAAHAAVLEYLSG